MGEISRVEIDYISSYVYHHRDTESTEIVIVLPDRETTIGQKIPALRAGSVICEEVV